MADQHRWIFNDRTGNGIEDLGLSAVSFPSQVEAEAWLGEEWQQLADAGVSSVTLMRGEDIVYDSMSLSP